MKPDICIYHANCTDGFTAAWAIHQRWPDIGFAAANYGDDPSQINIDGKHVLIVDFSYPRPVLELMLSKLGARSVIVLDHHKTAEAELAPFAEPQFAAPTNDLIPNDGIRAHFDMEKSGALLAWEFAHPGVYTPPLVKYVEDRDLWRWKLPFSREINAAIGSIAPAFDSWTALDVDLYSNPSRIRAEGGAILRVQDKHITQLIAASTRSMIIGGHQISVANVPFMWASDAGNLLAAGGPFGATYFDTSDGSRAFSLRSMRNGADVSEIAKLYGGGGHKHAAGFKMPNGWEGDQHGR